MPSKSFKARLVKRYFLCIPDGTTLNAQWFASFGTPLFFNEDAALNYIQIKNENLPHQPYFQFVSILPVWVTLEIAKRQTLEKYDKRKL